MVGVKCEAFFYRQYWVDLGYRGVLPEYPAPILREGRIVWTILIVVLFIPLTCVVCASLLHLFWSIPGSI
jgi:hypothetical protein